MMYGVLFDEDVSVNRKRPPKKWAAKDTSVYAWSQVFFCLCIFSASLAILYSFGVYVVPMADDFETGRGTVSWVASIMYFFAAVSSAVAGVSTDKYGPRPNMLFAGACIIVSAIATYYAPAIWVIYLSFGVLAGCATAFGTLPAITVVITWFDKYRGIASGIGAAGSGVGNLASPILAQMVMDNQGGDDWRSAVLYVGLVCGAIVMFAAIFLRFRPADVPAITLRPSINDEYASQKEEKSKGEILKEAIRTPYYKNFLLFIVFASWSFNVPILHIAPFAEDQGISEDDAAFLLSMLGAAQIVGRILHGVFADRFGAIKCLFVGILIMCVMVFLWASFLATYELILLFTIMYGLNYGAVFALPPVIIGEYFTGQNPAPLIGIYYSAGSIGNLVGPVIAGYIFDSTGSYFWAGILSGIPLLISLLFLGRMVLIYDRKIGRNHRKNITYDVVKTDSVHVLHNVASEVYSHSSDESESPGRRKENDEVPT